MKHKTIRNSNNHWKLVKKRSYDNSDKANADKNADTDYNDTMEDNMKTV